MANKPKQQGTALESHIRDEFLTAGIEARRDENNSALSDVRVDLPEPLGHLRVEAKARAALNAHKTMAEMRALYPDDQIAIVWKRLSRKGDNVKRTADGPTLVCMPLDQFIEMARRVR